MITSARTYTVAAGSNLTLVFGIPGNNQRIALIVTSDTGSGIIGIANTQQPIGNNDFEIHPGDTLILKRKDHGTYITNEFWVGSNNVGAINIYVSEVYLVSGQFPVGLSPLPQYHQE